MQELRRRGTGLRQEVVGEDEELAHPFFAGVEAQFTHLDGGVVSFGEESDQLFVLPMLDVVVVGPVQFLYRFNVL